MDMLDLEKFFCKKFINLSESFNIKIPDFRLKVSYDTNNNRLIYMVLNKTELIKKVSFSEVCDNLLYVSMRPIIEQHFLDILNKNSKELKLPIDDLDIRIAILKENELLFTLFHKNKFVKKIDSL